MHQVTSSAATLRPAAAVAAHALRLSTGNNFDVFFCIFNFVSSILFVFDVLCAATPVFENCVWLNNGDGYLFVVIYRSQGGTKD